MSILLLYGSAQAIELSDDELFWLTQNIYWESRNQSRMGQVLVALVTVNRMQDKRWPSTIQGVVTQRSQFSWFWDGKSDRAKEPIAWEKAEKVALVVCNLYDMIDPMHKRVYWFHRDDVNPSWRHQFMKYAEVERHIFYADNG